MTDRCPCGRLGTEHRIYRHHDGRLMCAEQIRVTINGLFPVRLFTNVETVCVHGRALSEDCLACRVLAAGTQS